MIVCGSMTAVINWRSWMRTCGPLPILVGIVGAERLLTERFAALATHYVFEPCSARPGGDHDKGGVESRGKAIRLQPLTPIPCGETFQAIAAATLVEVEQASRTKGHAPGQTAWAQFQEEHPHFRALPAVAFDARRTASLLVNNRAMVQMDGATYSVPSTWVGRTITALMGVEDFCRCWQGETQVSTPPRGAKVILYRHSLPELARRPQALRQVAPERMQALGEPYRALWGLLTKTHGERDAARIWANIVAAVVAHGEDGVTAALIQVTRDGSAPLQCAALPTVHEWLETLPVPTRIAVPEPLAGYEVEAGKARDDDCLRAGSLVGARPHETPSCTSTSRSERCRRSGASPSPSHGTPAMVAGPMRRTSRSAWSARCTRGTSTRPPCASSRRGSQQ